MMTETPTGLPSATGTIAPSRIGRRTLRAGLFVALTMVIMPLADALIAAIPYRLGDPQWRFGLVGVLSNAAVIPVAGVLLALVLAQGHGFRWFSRSIGVLSTIAGLFCLVALALFTFDAIETRRMVPPQVRARFDATSAFAALKLIGWFVALTLLGFAGLRREQATVESRPHTGPKLPLMRQ